MSAKSWYGRRSAYDNLKGCGRRAYLRPFQTGRALKSLSDRPAQRGLLSDSLRDPEGHTGGRLQSR